MRKKTFRKIDINTLLRSIKVPTATQMCRECGINDNTFRVMNSNELVSQNVIDKIETQYNIKLVIDSVSGMYVPSNREEKGETDERD